MPGGDGTGPLGQGPMTGRGAGFCAGFSTGGYANPLPRVGRGRRIGRGFRRMAFAQRMIPVYHAEEPTREQEKQYLENEVSAIEAEENTLKQDLEAVKKRLAELERK